MSSHPTPHQQSHDNVINNTISTPPVNGDPNPPSSLDPGLQVNGHGNGHGHASGSQPPPISWIERGSINRKRKWTQMGFNEDEQASMERTTIGFHLALAQDQVSTLYPDPPTRFTSYEDVVERLLPYHVWQICDEELEGQDVSPRKKEEEGHPWREGEKFITTVSLFNQRLMALRTREATRPSPTVDLISLIRESTSVLREEVSEIQRDYRRLHNERDAMEAANKAKLDREAYMRSVADISRQNEIRANEARAAMAAAKQREAHAAAVKARQTTATPSAASTPARTPQMQAQSQATPASASASGSGSQHQTPTPSRGRGRPRGSGGLRAQVLSHTVPPTNGSGTATSASTTPSPAGSLPASPSPGASPATPGPNSPAPATPHAPPQTANSSRPTRSNQAPANGSNSLPNSSMKGPVFISVPTTAVPDLLRVEILSRNPDPAVKPPATIARQPEDKKSLVLSIDLGKCNPKQLIALAKILKVDGGPGGGGTRDAVAQAASQGDGGS